MRTVMAIAEHAPAAISRRRFFRLPFGVSLALGWLGLMLVVAVIGCLLLDLLTADEQRADAIDHALRFDVELLGRRVAGVARRLGAGA